MPANQHIDIGTFFIAGINYRKTDADLRGQFAINITQYAQLIELAPQFGIHEFFVLSTCNRTEIYGFSEKASNLSQLLCSQTEGTLDTFSKMCYIKKGESAIRHLFNVAAGLDSQILGDYEIVGQIKMAVKFSKEHGFVGAYLERLYNAVLQASKKIKTTTALSGGTVSVAFAAIQYIKEQVKDISSKKILLIGTGKIGRNVCKNLVDYLDTKNITLINRTEFKAAELATELGLQYAATEDLPQQVQQSDIILVATNATEPIILTQQVKGFGNKIIIDLSVPFNVEKSVQTLSYINLVNVDELSKIKDATLENRKAEVPKATAIIKKYITEFLEWHQMRRNVPVLKAIKTKLYSMQSCEMFISCFSSTVMMPNTDDQIQKVINGTALKLRTQNQHGCYYIEAINEYIAIGKN